MKTGMSQDVIIKCQEIFVSNTRHLESFKGVLQYIAYNVHYAWQQHNLVIFTVYI